MEKVKRQCESGIELLRILAKGFIVCDHIKIKSFGRHWFPKVLAGLFSLLVLFGIHGSSVGEWKRVFKSHNEQYSFLHIGDSRSIRMDDWCVSQPFIFAQCNAKEFFPRVNKNVNGGTDMFLQTPCAPVWDWTALGQIHNWGYFVFGANRGTAWSWWIRYLGIPFFAYFFFLLWCRGDRMISIVGALAVTLASPTQWWDTTIPYHLLYFFSVLVMAQVVFGAKRECAIVLGGIGLLMSLLSYFFVMYPPFELLLLPALVILLVFVAKSCFTSELKWLRFGILLCVAVAFCAEIYYFFHVHGDVLKTIANSAYPGSRVCHGMTFAYLCQRFMLDLVSMFSWYDADTIQKLLTKCTVCSAAEYCSLFVPVLLAFTRLSFKAKRVDWFEAALVFVALVQVSWLSMDWPAALAKYTGFSRLPPSRVCVIQGFIVLLLVLRLFSRLEIESGSRLGLRGCVALAFIFLTCRIVALFVGADMLEFVNKSGVSMLRFEVALALSMAIWMSFISGRRRFFLPLMLVNAVLSGMFVHPLVNGLSPLFDSKIANAVQRIDAAGVWWSNDRIVGQLPLALGLKCFSGTQQYCDKAYWQVIDPTGAHERAWNRYAHRSVANFCDWTLFENRGRENTVWYNISDTQLRALNVNYVIWRGKRPRSDGLTEVERFGSNTTVYKVAYP